MSTPGDIHRAPSTLLWDHGTLDLACALPHSFDLARIVSPQLERWLRPCVLVDRLGSLPLAGGVATVGADRFEIARQQVGDTTLVLGSKLISMMRDSARFEAEQIAYVDCERGSGLSLDEIKQLTGHVRQWLCLMTGWPADSVEVHLRSSGTWFELWADLVGGTGAAARAAQPILGPMDCTHGPLDTLVRYLDFAARYGVLIPLLNGDMFSPFTFGENRFLNIVQAAESYHKERVSAPRSGKGQITFATCMRTLLDETGQLGQTLLRADSDLIENTKDLRNDIVHVNSPAAAKDGGKLRIYAEVWRWVLRSHFLAAITGQVVGDVGDKLEGNPWVAWVADRL